MPTQEPWSSTIIAEELSADVFVYQQSPSVFRLKTRQTFTTHDYHCVWLADFTAD